VGVHASAACKLEVLPLEGCARAHAATCRPPIADTGFNIRPLRIHGGWSSRGTDFRPSTSIFPCEYHTTKPRYSSIHPSL